MAPASVLTWLAPIGADGMSDAVTATESVSYAYGCSAEGLVSSA